MDPRTAEPIERAGAGEGALRVLHVLHGSLMVPGVGRQIVGWVGVAMLLSSLTGLWLWWPLKGSFIRGLRWRRRPDYNFNLHSQAGFWIALPLAVLSLTGVWISFPTVFSGGAAAGPGPGAAQPLAAPNLSADRALAAARPLADGPLRSISWPTDKQPKWKLTVDGTEIEVSDSGAKASVVPPKPETLARTMRRIHDGSGMPFAWQIIIFAGGILPAVLAVTGLLMWVRTRRRRQKHRRNAAPAIEATV
jgi:uncharacterized iron-regulated membrane protein